MTIPGGLLRQKVIYKKVVLNYSEKLKKFNTGLLRPKKGNKFIYS